MSRSSLPVSSSGIREQLLDRVAGVSDAVLRPHLPGDLPRPAGVPRCPYEVVEAPSGTRGGVAPRVEHLGTPQPLDPQGIVGLVDCEGDDELRSPGAEHLTDGADSPLVHDGCGPWEELRERRVVDGRGTLGQRHWKAALRVLAAQ